MKPNDFIDLLKNYLPPADWVKYIDNSLINFKHIARINSNDFGDPNV